MSAEEKATKPLPVPSPDTLPYWQAAREGRLRIQQCRSCSAHQFYPRVLCTQCGKADVGWVDAKGLGTVESFTVVRRAIQDGYAREVPYVVALVRLEEGPRMMCNIVESSIDDVSIGARVEVVFEARSADVAVPQFRLVVGT